MTPFCRCTSTLADHYGVWFCFNCILWVVQFISTSSTKNSVFGCSTGSCGERPPLLYHCNFFFLFRQCIEKHDVVLLFTSMSEMLSLLPFLFMMCHFGENVTIAFENLNESIYNISWYLAPVKLQKYLVPMLATSGESFYFESIASLNCSHQSFKKVNIAWLLMPTITEA